LLDKLASKHDTQLFNALKQSILLLNTYLCRYRLQEIDAKGYMYI